MWIEASGITVEITIVFLIGCFEVMVQSSVIFAHGKGPLHELRFFNFFCNFARRIPIIRQSKGLVVNIAINIALFFEEVADVFVAPLRPAVTGEVDFRLVTE